MNASLEQFELADQVGFDWVTVAEHHFAPMSLTPNPMILAGALTQRVKHAKIALLGADIPILNPVRVAEVVRDARHAHRRAGSSPACCGARRTST
jgi:alkanesulfonate monooxygenase SsuD/methylene tetrahydromethanopterin reductase-like flavin-dependent oxidoreductase (luciferase family)